MDLKSLGISDDESDKPIAQSFIQLDKQWKDYKKSGLPKINYQNSPDSSFINLAKFRNPRKVRMEAQHAFETENVHQQRYRTKIIMNKLGKEKSISQVIKNETKDISYRQDLQFKQESQHEKMIQQLLAVTGTVKSQTPFSNLPRSIEEALEQYQDLNSPKGKLALQTLKQVPAEFIKNDKSEIVQKMSAPAGRQEAKSLSV